MPCRDPGWEYGDSAIGADLSYAKIDLSMARLKIDELTAMLCGVMKQIAGSNKIMRSLSPDTLIWWKQHQEFDKRRQANGET